MYSVLVPPFPAKVSVHLLQVQIGGGDPGPRVVAAVLPTTWEAATITYFVAHILSCQRASLMHEPDGAQVGRKYHPTRSLPTFDMLQSLTCPTCQLIHPLPS